jgi:hypothetical protein
LSAKSIAVVVFQGYYLSEILDSSSTKVSTSKSKRNHQFYNSAHHSKVISSNPTDSSSTASLSDSSASKKKQHPVKLSKRSRKKKKAESDAALKLKLDSLKEDNKSRAKEYTKDSLHVEISKADTLLKEKLGTIKEENRKSLSVYSKDSLKNKFSYLDTSISKAKDDFVREMFSMDSTKKDKIIAQKKELLQKKKQELISGKLKKDKNYFERTNGNVNLGYDYGVVPFVVGGKTPSGFMRSDGSMGLDILKIPVIFNYYYASVKNITGLNNFFRLSLDVPKYKENALNKLNEEEQELKSNLKELYSSSQLLEQKILYLKAIQNKTNFSSSLLPKGYPGTDINNSDYENEFEDSLTNAKIDIKNKLSTNTLPDSLKSDSLDKYKNQEDKKEELKKAQQKADSINQVLKKYQVQKEKVQNQIEEVNKKMKMIHYPDSFATQMGSKYKKLGILDNIKKFEIGLCYPDYSTFLISGSGVKGVNLELQKSQLFFAFTYGKTINNLLFTNNVIQNNLQNVRNLFNFFDFNEVNNSRRVTAIKLGIGAKDKSHIHAGFLYGIGQNSYQVFSENTSSLSIDKEKNYVVEIDGKYQFNKKYTLDVVYGKSFLQQNSSTDSTRGLSALLKSNQNTNAALARFTAALGSTRIQLSSRYVDPFFRSFGVGFMRSDNFRYEIKVDHTLSSKLKIGASYKREQDNLLQLNFITTNLQTVNTYASYRPVRQLTLRFSFSPVLQRVNSEDKTIRLENRNYISNAIISYSPRLKHNSTTFTALYNYFQLYDGKQNSIYQNYSFVNTLTVGEFKNELAVSYFDSNIPDSLVTNSLLYSDDVSLRVKKKYILSVGAKLSQNKSGAIQTGYTAKVNIPLTKYMAIELSGEKVVLGDFYNNVLLEQIDKFPYFFFGKLIFNW